MPKYPFNIMLFTMAIMPPQAGYSTFSLMRGRGPRSRSLQYGLPTVTPTLSITACPTTQPLGIIFSHRMKAPNARGEPRPEAEARYERTL